MRIFQIILLVLAVIAFIVAAIFYASCLGLVLWRVGVAILLVDIVLILLWPTKP